MEFVDDCRGDLDRPPSVPKTSSTTSTRSCIRLQIPRALRPVPARRLSAHSPAERSGSVSRSDRAGAGSHGRPSCWSRRRWTLRGHRNSRFPVTNIVEPRHPEVRRAGRVGTRAGRRPRHSSTGAYTSTAGGRHARGQYFEGIAPDVWEFRIGGYQPLRKWLQDRKGRRLSYDDQIHYIHIAAALRETIRLMAAIDQAELPFPSV